MSMKILTNLITIYLAKMDASMPYHARVENKQPTSIQFK